MKRLTSNFYKQNYKYMRCKVIELPVGELLFENL